MKRIKSLLVLGLLSLFLGVTTVTTYAQSNSASVKAGITFIEDETNGNDSNASQDDTSSGDSSLGGTSSENTSQDDASNGAASVGNTSSDGTEGRLPKTGEKSSTSLTIIGVLCLGILFCLVNRSSKKER
ncbi:LPXTG cell wall anchor domain-containing protein [Enterococcus casseliflavus]|nr:LPXTG cell wall anchor domain-containing protein [Enterococcus casseliflavus]